MQHKIPVRERVVASAKKLFSERGFHRTAMADLAQEAQVSVGAIYRCFASKSDIISDIIRADTDETLNELRSSISAVRSGETSGRSTIERMILEWASRQDEALYHEITAEAHRNPEVAEIVSSTCGEFRVLLRELVALLTPDLSDAEIEGVAELLLACLFGLGNREFTSPRLDAEQTAAIVTQILLRGVRAT